MSSDLLHGFRVGPWTVEPLEGIITGPDSESCHLQPKVMDVLVCLAARADEPVTRDELLKEVWGENAVSDEPLTRAIGELRRALHDDRGRPQYIKTIPKRGYRLIGEVQLPEGAREKSEIQSQLPGDSTAEGNGMRLFSRPTVIFGSAGLVAIALIYVAYLAAFNTQTPTDPLSANVTKQSAPPNSVAVLPFRNRSALAEDANFVDGIHDDILTQLSKLSSLDKVISRTSMEQYRDTTKPMPQIGEELGVATILQGGVQRSGNRVRINMQLIDAQADEHLWVETYDRQLTAENLFAIQSEVSREIAAVLQIVLTDQESERLRTLPTTSLDAYREYLLGRREASRRTAESVRRAQAHFEKAIELDADYSLAYVGLAESVALQTG